MFVFPTDDTFGSRCVYQVGTYLLDRAKTVEDVGNVLELLARHCNVASSSTAVDAAIRKV
jgi:hypothetical protein